MAQTMSMGQAAGLAAVLSLQKNCGANEIDIKILQEQLHCLGAVMELPGIIADTSRNGWKNNFAPNP